MKTLVVIPVDWQCTLLECPPGLFVLGDELCVKSEYYTQHENRSVMEVFIAASGEYVWGGAKTYDERDKLIVTPCAWEWQDLDR